MTEELKLDLMKKFRELNVAEYTTKYGDYYGLMFAGAEIATKELQEEIKKTQHLADVRCDQAVENYQKWHVTNREKIDLEIKVEELEKQIEKMKCCENCKYGYCGGSSISIDKNGNKTFHNWNEEKQEYCDIGKNGKYQCWELAEN